MRCINKKASAARPFLYQKGAHFFTIVLSRLQCELPLAPVKAGECAGECVIDVARVLRP